MSVLVQVAVAVIVLAAGALGWLRWLRVLQREHYLPGSTIRFAWRWWSNGALNIVAGLIGLAGLVLAWWFPGAAIATGAVVAIGPLGLSPRGRTSPLAWTRRLKTLASVSGGMSLVLVGAGVLIGKGAPVSAIVAIGVPFVIDLSALALRPVESRASQGFVEQATARLAKVQPKIVGVTGSYGKTSTKQLITSLVGADMVVVPSPRSFNNRAGLARAINEHLSDGTQVFIAEMGTYGPGEIADMVAWCPPDIAVITAIGPVHLERFGTLDVTVKAKSEIFAEAPTVILNVDDPRLDALSRSVPPDKDVVRASATRHDVDVAVVPSDEEWVVSVQGEVVGRFPAPIGVQPSNVACAIGVALALGMAPEAVIGRVGLLGAAENRLTSGRSAAGITVVDDTFNSNPAGTVAALAALVALSDGGRRVVVTPGMIELGREQAVENERFGERAASVADVLIIVGTTNARSLREGASRQASCAIISVRTREEAVAWVRSNLGDGDVVLYENDFPDHYP